MASRCRGQRARWDLRRTLNIRVIQEVRRLGEHSNHRRAASFCEKRQRKNTRLTMGSEGRPRRRERLYRKTFPVPNRAAARLGGPKTESRGDHEGVEDGQRKERRATTSGRTKQRAIAEGYEDGTTTEGSIGDQTRSHHRGIRGWNYHRGICSTEGWTTEEWKTATSGGGSHGPQRDARITRVT